MVDCQATGEKLVYDCMIMLTDKTRVRQSWTVSSTVRADMPSMAGVHNVEPVAAHHHQVGNVSCTN